MISADTTSDSRRQSRRWAAAAVVLLLAGAGCLTVGLRGNHNALAGPVAHTGSHQHPGSTSGQPPEASGGGPQQPPTSSGATKPAVSYSVPVQLRIPALHMVVPLERLGLNPDGTVEVPTDPDEPGWFRFGPPPGQMGSAVILGHVDSYEGPAVFLLLRFLDPGDVVKVKLADGVVTHFVVTKVKTYPNAVFPAQKVYGSHGYAGLQLVTCGGNFDTTTQSYQANVVVFTSLVRTSTGQHSTSAELAADGG